jgi:hypothetical protein
MFISGDYIKKIFVEIVDALSDQSVLSLLENYDSTESCFVIALKSVLIKEGLATK